MFYTPLPWTPIPKLDNLHLWINDGLMEVFFFVVGLELKHEFVHGDLRDPAKATVPVVAAACGVAVPAIVFTVAQLLLDGDLRGWADDLLDPARLAGEDKDRKRAAQESVYRFMTALAGNLPAYEDATRALYADDSGAGSTTAWSASAASTSIAVS